MDTAIPPYGTRGQNSVKGTGGRWAWVEGADGRGMWASDLGAENCPIDWPDSDQV